MQGHVQYRGKTASGQHRARYQLRNPLDPSRFVNRTFHGRTRREAEDRAQAWGAEQQAKVRRGDWQDPRHAERLFRDVADEYRDTWLDLEPRTKAGYDHILGLHVLPRFGAAKISAIRAQHVQSWLNELAATRSRNTVRRINGVLRGVMTTAVQRGYITANPCDATKLPKKGSARDVRVYLTPEEVNAIADAIDPHYRVAVYVASYCGLRAGELWALRRRDVDAIRGELTVARALKPVHGAPGLPAHERGLIFGEPKSATSKRRISLPQQIRAMLAEHLAQPLAGGDGPDALVFTTPGGGPIRHDNFRNRVFLPAVAAVFPAGHPKAGLRWHDLRHTCAAMTLSVAPNLYLVMTRLGHSDIRTTVNTYGHLLPSAEAALADGLEQLFDGATAPADVIPIEAARES